MNEPLTCLPPSTPSCPGTSPFSSPSLWPPTSGNGASPWGMGLPHDLSPCQALLTLTPSGASPEGGLCLAVQGGEGSLLPRKSGSGCSLPFLAANPPCGGDLPMIHRTHQASDHQAYTTPSTQICGLSGQQARRPLHAAGKPRASCLPSASAFFPPRWPLCQRLPLTGTAMASPAPQRICPFLPQPLPPPPPAPPLASLSISPFFLPCTGNCEPVRESPGVFSSKRYPAVLRRAQRATVNVTLSPCSCTCRPSRPLRFTRGSPSARRFSGGRRATMFSVHSEIKSTTFDLSNLFCG